MKSAKVDIKKRAVKTDSSFFSNVGVRRLELPTPCTPCKYASQLRHTPFFFEAAKLQKNPNGCTFFVKKYFYFIIH